MRQGVLMRRSRRHAADRGGRSVLLVLAGAALCGLVAIAGSGWPEHPSGPSGPSGASEPSGASGASVREPDGSLWESVLTGLLARRAEAFAAGDHALLAGVYLPGAEVLRRDQQVLRAWQRRGLLVEGASVRLRTVTVVDHAPRSVLLRTVDRLGPAVAVGPRGETRALPRDRLSAHRIALTHTPDGWRIATIRALSG